MVTVFSHGPSSSQSGRQCWVERNPEWVGVTCLNQTRKQLGTAIGWGVWLSPTHAASICRPNGNWVSITKCLSSECSKGQGQPHQAPMNGLIGVVRVSLAGHPFKTVGRLPSMWRAISSWGSLIGTTLHALQPAQGSCCYYYGACQAISKHMEQLATYQTVKWTADLTMIELLFFHSLTGL